MKQIRLALVFVALVTLPGIAQAPLSVEWTNNVQETRVGKDGDFFQLGLRSDGCVVWRRIDPELVHREMFLFPEPAGGYVHLNTHVDKTFDKIQKK